jgi:hypothetical protein
MPLRCIWSLFVDDGEARSLAVRSVCPDLFQDECARRLPVNAQCPLMSRVEATFEELTQWYTKFHGTQSKKSRNTSWYALI